MNSLQLTSDSPFLGKVQKTSFALIVLGVICTGVALLDVQRFFASWVLGYSYVIGIAVTMMFFSALQFLVRAGWSAAVRRVAELFAGFIPYGILGFVPIIVGMYSGQLYPWAAPETWSAGGLALSEHAQHVVHSKHAFLNPTFFVIRILAYGLLWLFMYTYIIKNSLKQDSASDFAPTRKNMKRAAPFVLMYALTITFAGVDVVMSLAPTWFSTMFGVYYFAGNFVSALSLLAIFVIKLVEAGHLKKHASMEHYHDIGKFLFAFTVFWAYIAFCQYMLIWYSNIPEETEFFIHRVNHGWEIIAYSTIFLHFVIPFFLLLRQDAKRKGKTLALASVVMLVANFVDLAWIILPNFSKELKITVGDFGPGLLLFGLLLYTFVRQAKSHNIVAVNDPYLKESVELIS